MEINPNVENLEANSTSEDEVWGMPKYQQNYLSNLTNLTDEQYLAVVLGPQRIGWKILFPITFFYVMICISGVFGNVAVCLVIIKNKSMHTATNYYLFSLAISDLMILVLGLPNDLAIYWQQYPWMLGEICCRLRSWVSEMTSYSSVLIIVAFSMERYLAICHPLYSHTMSGFKRAVRIIVLVWFLAMLSAIPYALFTRLNYVDRPLGSGNFLHESAFCALLESNIYPQNYPVYELSSFVFFIFPMCILCVLYIRMGLKIRETSGIQRNLPTTRTNLANNLHQQAANTLSNSSNSVVNTTGTQGANLRLNTDDVIQNQERQLNAAKRSILRMLAAVVLAFFLCWAPFHAQRLGYVYFKDSILFRTLNEYLFHVSGFFYYLSATVNPILYNLMSLKYRHAFRQTLCSKNRRGLGGGGGSNAYGGRRGTDELDTGQPLRSYTFRSSSRSGMTSDIGNSVTMGGTSGTTSTFRFSKFNYGGAEKKPYDGCSLGGQSSTAASGCIDSESDCFHLRPRMPTSFKSHFHRKVKTKSDFKAAMKKAETACSDIMEEEGSSSQQNNSNSAIQLKILKNTKNQTSMSDSEDQLTKPLLASQKALLASNKSFEASTQTISLENELPQRPKDSVLQKPPTSADSPDISEVVCSNCKASQCLFETSKCRNKDSTEKTITLSTNSNIGNSTKKDQRTVVDPDDDGDSGTGSVDCLISKSPSNSNGTTMVVVHVDPLSGTEVINNL